MSMVLITVQQMYYHKSKQMLYSYQTSPIIDFKAIAAAQQSDFEVSQLRSYEKYLLLYQLRSTYHHIQLLPSYSTIKIYFLKEVKGLL